MRTVFNFLIFRRVFADCDGLVMVNSAKQENFVHKLARPTRLLATLQLLSLLSVPNSSGLNLGVQSN